MKLDIKVMGVHDRDFLLEDLKKSLNLKDTDIIYDDRPKGGDSLYTYDLAAHAPMEDDVTHRLIMPDDMIVCDNFLEKVNYIINNIPQAVINLFPYNWSSYSTLPVDQDFILNQDSFLYVIPGIFGNGVIYPVEVLEDCFNTLHEVFPDDEVLYNYRDDGMITMYLQATGKLILTSIPPLVQHIGDFHGSVLKKYSLKNGQPRIAPLFDTTKNLPSELWNNNMFYNKILQNSDDPQFNFLFGYEDEETNIIIKEKIREVKMNE